MYLQGGGGFRGESVILELGGFGVASWGFCLFFFQILKCDFLKTLKDNKKEQRIFLFQQKFAPFFSFGDI